MDFIPSNLKATHFCFWFKTIVQLRLRTTYFWLKQRHCEQYAYDHPRLAVVQIKPLVRTVEPRKLDS